MAGESGEWKCDPEIVMSEKEWRDCEKLREVHAYIEMVEEIVRPGCSPEVLNIVLASVTDLVDRLSSIPSQKELRCSL